MDHHRAAKRKISNGKLDQGSTITVAEASPFWNRTSAALSKELLSSTKTDYVREADTKLLVYDLQQEDRGSDEKKFTENLLAPITVSLPKSSVSRTGRGGRIGYGRQDYREEASSWTSQKDQIKPNCNTATYL
jgi:hypothetical protein